MNAIYKLKELAFDYGTGFGLSDINLEIERSKITAIVGPNGAGKTSLLNVLAFLSLPGAGIFEYNGSPLERSKLAQFKKTVAYVQQSPYLLRGTAAKNIELGLKLRHVGKASRLKQVSAVMSLLGISDLAGRDARSLSGGEAQKVAIGQVLVLAPDVLILDEPFTHLDKHSIHELEQIILRLRDELQKTIIFTTHNQYQAQWLADHIYSVINGKVFKSQLINLFSGHFDVEGNRFNTGKQLITLADGVKQAEHIAIDPRQIVLSKQRLDSSMQNSYCGKVNGMFEEAGQVKLSINAGEIFQVVVTHKALSNLDLTIGGEIWISFKSSSILIF